MTGAPDVCIIGAGPAGAILAAVLAERGHEVIVLDAGPRFAGADRHARMERELRPAFTRADVWDMGGPRDAFTTSGAVDYALNARRVKGIGGTTLHWQGSVQRLHPEDFEMRSRHGVANDWPISYDDLEPYYVQAERELGVAGEPSPFGGDRSASYPLPAHPPSYLDQIIGEGFSTAGLELHACPTAINSEPYDGRPQCVGYGTCNPVCPSGAKYSADVHINRAEQAGATVFAEASVERLEHTDAGDRVTAAVTAHRGSTTPIRANVFVIAAGAVESARLLLLSKSLAHPRGLANGSDMVGRRFMEHPSVKLAARLDHPSRQHLIGFDTSISEQYYGHADGPMGSMLFQIDNDHGDSPVEAALTGGTTMNRMVNESPSKAVTPLAFGDPILDGVHTEYGHGIGVVALVEDLPSFRHHVGLSSDATDANGNPAPDIHYSITDRTRKTLERAVTVLERIVESLPVTDIHPVGSPDNPSFANHHMGTTRMGSRPESSVVNPALRTHDVDNLYVSSSSVFVTGGAATPTLTIAALTLRLADHLDDVLAT